VSTRSEPRKRLLKFQRSWSTGKSARIVAQPMSKREVARLRSDAVAMRKQLAKTELQLRSRHTRGRPFGWRKADARRRGVIFRLNDDELNKLERLAKRAKTSVSDVLRELLRKAK
jgi:uncharacterized protein (DUF4415 family)